MKKVLFFMLLFVIGLGAMAQQRIQLQSADKAECVKSDMTSLKASFSFSAIEVQDFESERGKFSWLSMANTVIGGNEGDPQIPVINELIAVPFGATPHVEIKSYSSTDYHLDDLGMHTLVPRQPSLRKDKRPEEVPFVMNEETYQSNRDFRSAPAAVVEVVGTMRGVRLGKLTIEPVSYDPVNNILRVFNDIEVTVSFDGANARATEQMLVDTYSPYFNGVYKQLFNGKAVLDAYSSHPDLYNTPVKMLVVATSTYINSTAFQNWLTWKKQKGIDVDIYTVTSSTASSTIRSTIQSRYNANHPTFLVIVGDETVVKAYTTSWSCGSSYGNCINDLEYASVDGDVYHDMYMSRMSVSSTTELGYLVNKILTYEKYTMSDPSYLNNSLLVAGWDASWTNRVGKPTIQYANNNYYNSAHGINPTVYITTGSGQTAAYNNINNVGFLNYTAHGDIQELADPEFTTSNVNSMTNNGKYLWVVANCCLSANWGNSSYTPCLGEAMIRANNKGAFGYIGSIPESYWYEDYYFGVGAFSYVASTVQTTSSTTTGMYDAAFDDNGFNTLNSMPYIGNVAVTYAHAAGYTSSVTDEYYWRAYQCLGDGSVMPYLKNPAANNVSHNGTLPLGSTSYTVNADAGSYVSITVNNEIIGVAVVPAGSTSVNVTVAAQSVPGTAMIVVTRAQRQPYIGSINIVGGNQYDITVTQPQHGTISAPTQAYANATVTLTATPETGYCLSSWNVRDASNNSITVTNNQFTMPESDVTVTATFVRGLNVTLAPATNGTISADPTCALQGTTINLTATPATGYVFDSWVVYKTGDASTTVNVSGNSFTMPAYDVTVVGIFLAPAGGDVTIGSGTATTNGAYLPTYAYYNYSLTQQIYTASEVGTAGTITKVAFKVSNSKSTTRNLDLYLSHTSNTSFSSNSGWISQSTSNRVFSGNVTFNASGWTTITLSSPFEYNGTSNLLLTVDDNTGSYVSSSSNSPQFYTYSASNNTAIYKYDDNTNYNPSSMSTSGTRVAYKDQVVFTKEVPSTDGYLSVSPASLTGFEAAFGVTASNPQSVAVIGSNLQANLTVTAPTGYEVCTSSDGTYNNTLTLTPSNGSIRANVFVRLSSSVDPGNYNGDMTFSSGTTGATVSLSGTVAQGTLASYQITATVNPTEGGTVTGTGTYYENSTCTLTATSNLGYSFTNWMMNGNEVSTDSIYSFTVTGDCELVANFTKLPEPCYAPTNLTASEVGSNTATLTWTESGEAGEWVLQYGTDNSFAANTYTEMSVDGMPTVELAELTAETQYYARVKAVCGEDNESEWSNVVDFYPTAYVVIGTGTGTNNYLPTNASYKYSMTQQIYTAEELGAAGNILSIGFIKNNTAECARNLDIYMVSTEKSGYTGTKDWVPVTAANKVFSGTVNFVNNDWTTITLDVPFSYDGESNVAIMVDDNTASAGTSTPFLSFPAESQALRISSRNTNYNVSYSYTGTVSTSKNQLRIMKGDYASVCLAPTGLAISEIDHQSAVVNWNSEASSWKVAYRPANAESFTEVDVTTNTYTLTGLAAETEYTVKVASVCGTETVWGEEKSFTTLSLPCFTIELDANGTYQENFDECTSVTTSATGAEPDCWEVYPLDGVTLNESTKPQVFYNAEFASSGNYSLRLRNRCVYAMPELSEGIEINTLTLSFSLRQPRSIYRLQVGVVNASGEFELLKEIHNASTGVEPVKVELSEYDGDGRRIAFRNVLSGSLGYDYSINYIDDVMLFVETASCEIDTLPYRNGFEEYTNVTVAATGVEPDCWEVYPLEDVTLNESTKPQVFYNPDFASSGDYSLRLRNRCVYAMPALSEGIEINALTLTFSLRQPRSIYRLQVGVLNASGEFELVKEIRNANTSVLPVSVDFSEYDGDGRRIAFRNVLSGSLGYDYSINYIDDIDLDYTEAEELSKAVVADGDAMDADRYLTDIVVYPNPTKDVVNVQCTMDNVQCSGIEVVDIYGKIITTVGTRFIASDQTPVQINVSGLAAGMYFVRVTTDRGVVTKPFVKR